MPKQILLVDDTPSQIDRVRNMLTPLGADISDVANGQEALDFLSTRHPDLILMDIVMPVMDGFAATRKIKANANTKDIPVIMLSTKNEQTDHVWAQLQGAEKLISKPIESEYLVAEVQKWI